MASASSSAEASSDGGDLPVVVVGGGIVGLCSALFLSRGGHKVIIVEKCGVACHSSGKAGGFLTDGDSGWHRGGLADFARHGFAMCEELANEYGAERVGYRRVRCVGKGSGTAVDLPAWVPPDFQNDMGDFTGLAQVQPRKLCMAILEEIRGRGVEVLTGKVVGVQTRRDGTEVSAVRIEREEEAGSSLLPCRAAIFAMGPWAREMRDWFPGSALPRNTVSRRYTSVVFDDQEVGKDATMVFISDQHSVEFYPRLEECYASGCPTNAELPDDPNEIVPPPETVEMVKAETVGVIERLKTAQILRTSACFLPGSDDGRPVIGLVPKVKNAVVACGGGCWGILLGPAMGKASAALALGEEPTFNLMPYSPLRLDRSCGADVPGIGLPPKVLALLAKNPDLAQVVRQKPEALEELFAMAEARGDED